MNTLTDTLQYFFIISLELIGLFLLISTIVGLILMHIPEERVRKKLVGKGLYGNAIGGLFGALTPFCACSTIPITAGFLQARVPFGAIMSFLIASPLLNPIIIGMLGAMVGIKAAAIYFVVAFGCAVMFGYFLEKIGAQRYVKNIRIKGNASRQVQEENKAWPWSRKISHAFGEAWNGMRPVLPYLFIGVGIGAAIYGYLPGDFVLKVAGQDNMLAIPIAAVLGIPLYIRAETAIPIGLALLGKGMGIGAVIALIIGGAGMAIPEMSMLASLFKRKLVIMIIAVIFLTAVAAGYLFNVLS
ncbi:permease [Parapedobacter tibetensis]|uniref:permease n=1 Tax=Parapedobacter tibetensis TaxID=2972951 RepID=UPI00214DB261|nr:permease [Parapedobacter tibetensis]